MITNIKFLKRYCSEYTKIENYAEAVRSPLKYDLHHRREISESKSKSDLIEENLYYNRPAEELIFLEHGEHIRLHKANLSDETKNRMSEAQKGHLVSEDTRQKMSEAKKGEKCYMYGKPKSAETKQKLSDALKGKHWHLENCRRIYTD